MVRQVVCIEKSVEVVLQETEDGYYTPESMLKATRDIRNSVRNKTFDWTLEDLAKAQPVPDGTNPLCFGSDGSGMEIISNCDDDLLNLFYKYFEEERSVMEQELKTLFNNKECKTIWLKHGIHGAGDWVIANMKKQGYVWEDFINVFWDIQKQQHASNNIHSGMETT